jgi:YihY family inner membrane protein
MDIKRILTRVDEFQQRRSWLAFPFAVVKKFGDDQAGNLAALIAYYGFLSLFPLLLVMVAVLGLILRGDPNLQARILDSALAQFPIIGDQLKRNITALTGQGAGVALGVGTAVALWGGLGGMQAAQNAMNEVWDVPMKERPNFIKSRLRGLIMLVVLGTFILAATFMSGLGTSTGALGLALRVVGFGASVALNLAAFMLAYRVLTARDISWGQVFPGAVFAAIVWGALQAVGSFYVSHSLKHATAVYGFFGFVLGLLAWIYLGAQVTLYGAEINVVRVRRLWPRNLVQPPLSDADERTLRDAAKAQERLPQQQVEVTFDEGEDSASAKASAGSGETD